MSSDDKVIIEYFPMFQKTLEKLNKKYPHIKDDINPIIQGFRKSEFPGDRDNDFRYPIYKLRINNTDIKKGKKGGYRLIYLKKENTFILLIILYSKSDQKDLTKKQIKSINKSLDNLYNQKGWN